MRNIFLEKSYTKCVGKASSRPFYKKSKCTNNLKCYLFILCPSRVLLTLFFPMFPFDPPENIRKANHLLLSYINLF